MTIGWFWKEKQTKNVVEKQSTYVIVKSHIKQPEIIHQNFYVKAPNFRFVLQDQEQQLKDT